MNTSLARGLSSWFTFWIVLALVFCYLLWPLRHTLRFGIDLVGGTFITLEVQTEKAVEAELQSKLQAISKKLNSAGKEAPALKAVEKGAIVLTFNSPAAAQSAAQLIQGYDKDLHISTENQVVRITLTEALTEKIQDNAVESNVEVLRNRLNRLSVEEITIARQGKRNIIVELPDVSDPQQAKEMIGRSAVLEFKLVEKVGRTEEDLLYDLDGILPGDKEILPSQEERDGKPAVYYLVSKFAEVSGKDLRDAYVSISEGGRGGHVPVVNFRFTTEGGEKFYELTSNNINKRLAVVLDGIVITAPNIKTGIHDQGYIEGQSNITEAKNLALMLRSGAFVAPVTFEEERQIGPSLGAESIRQGLVSCLVGLGLLLVFSVIVYKWCGLLAFLSLLYNLLLILFALSILRATLTLPGIAGMVLTVGMAIDASILIYEQIKDGLAAGLSIRKAVSDGFSDALVVILDANITTFIVGAVLYYFGTGPIKGFAVTMMLGIISTLITGLFFLKATFNFILDTFNIQKLRI
jgi:preprotein translocase subunit SecD